MATNITVEDANRVLADPAWFLVWEGFDPLRERDVESSMTIGNGYLGTRGSLEEGGGASRPATLIAGVYAALAETGHIPELVVAPNWLPVTVWIEGERLCLDSGQALEHRRILDMRHGALAREWLHQDANGRRTRFRSVRWASVTDRHAVCLRIWLTPENYAGRIKIESAIDGDVGNVDGAAPGGILRYLEPAASEHDDSGVLLAMRTRETRPRVSPITIAMAAGSRIEAGGGQAAQPSVTRSALTTPLKAAEVFEFAAEAGVTYRLDKLVSIWTSRDEGVLARSTATLPAHISGDGSRSADQTEAAGSSGSLDPRTWRTVRATAGHLRDLLHQGMDALRSDTEAVWEADWENADVSVDEEWAQHVIRFSMYHLMIAANPDDEHVSVSARTLSGQAYKGHVFWDTEVFMLPFYAFTSPRAARALLMYRYWTLAGARGKARTHGYEGAMYAWESGDTGMEATPAQVVLPTGAVVKVLSGIEEHHITADVAYGVWQYWRATGDDDFMKRYGAEIILECARFWASRAEEAPDGKFHIGKIIGPDEYHEDVDDDAFTNAMAAWTLDTAAQVGEWMRNSDEAAWLGVASRIRYEDFERKHWQEVARRMYTGFDEKTGLIEQFKGFFKLEEIDLKLFEPRVAPMDILLGRDRTQRSQVVKQADVVMLFQLLPDRFSKEVMESDFEYYEPRTGHGSSLSPATHALVAARLGHIDTALRYFKLAGQIDLGNAMGNSSGGIHGATCGGIWQAVVFGFAGLRVGEETLGFDPHLPPEWHNLKVALTFRGRHMTATMGGDPPEIEVRMLRGELPVKVAVGPVDGVVSGDVPLRAVQQGGAWVLKSDRAGPEG